jgi:hypothetical protein
MVRNDTIMFKRAKLTRMPSLISSAGHDALASDPIPDAPEAQASPPEPECDPQSSIPDRTPLVPKATSIPFATTFKNSRLSVSYFSVLRSPPLTGSRQVECGQLAQKVPHELVYAIPGPRS